MATFVDDLRQGCVERIRLSPVLRARNFLTTRLLTFSLRNRVLAGMAFANQRALWAPLAALSSRLLSTDRATLVIENLALRQQVTALKKERPRPRSTTSIEPDQVKRWVGFLHSHKNDIAAMDLFTVPTASLRLLYGFFVIEHGRRHVVHFNATCHPTAAWVIQQLREAFPYETASRYLIFDRDTN